MFTKLISQFEDYDKYGEHRLNGLKGVYLLMILFLVNFIYKIPNPYFNYFYVPLTAMTISVTAESIHSKLFVFFYTVMGSVLTVFIFSLTDIYPTFFIMIVFCLSLSLYLITIHYFKNNIATVPVMLSLGIYSLVYGHINTDIFIAVNNVLITITAMLIILAAMLFFPKNYYFRVWLRSYILLLKQIQHNLHLVKNNEEKEIQVVQGHLVQLIKYSNMLSKRLPIFTILKINFLVNELRVLSCTIDQKIVVLDTLVLDELIDKLTLYIKAVELERPFKLEDSANKDLLSMTNSWNYLCSKI